MDPNEWFEMIWAEEEKKDPTHRGISKERARQVFMESWNEMDGLFGGRAGDRGDFPGSWGTPPPDRSRRQPGG